MIETKGIFMNTDKLKQLLCDKEFCERLLDLETPEQVQELLKENDVELTLEEIDNVKDVFGRFQNDELTDDEKKTLEFYQSHTDGELSDEALETVAGGFLDPLSWFVVGLIIATVIGGGAAVANKATKRRW